MLFAARWRDAFAILVMAHLILNALHQLQMLWWRQLRLIFDAPLFPERAHCLLLHARVPVREHQG
jgi:hypothetical protein